MYAGHFGLREMPFTITPDTSFFFTHPVHQDALNTLLIAARMGEGFIKVTGEVGTGKTLVCRLFLAALEADGNVVTAYLPNPCLGPAALLGAILEELGVATPPGADQHVLLRALTGRLIDAHADGQRVVLCLDEVQAMPVETLEALRLLTNLETEKRKLLQIVLFGQPELDARLASPSVRQLLQRITFSCRLVPLSAAGVRAYLHHRLLVAGRDGSLFSTAAQWYLAHASRGFPRLINILSHKALLAAFGEGQARVQWRHARAAAADTEGVWLPGAHAWRRYLSGTAVALAVSALALLWMRAR